jgi:hypothetical protein
MRSRHPGALRFSLAATALALGVLAQALVGNGNLRWAATPYLVAVAAFALAGFSSLRALDFGRDGSRSRPVQRGLGLRIRTGWRQDPERVLGLGAVALSVLMLLGALWGFGNGPPNTVAWYAYGASVLVLLLALPALEGRWTGFVRRSREGPRISIGIASIWPWAALCLILMLAVLIRVYNLDELPAGLWYDEADNISQALRIQQEPGDLPVFVPSTNLPSLFLLPIAAVIELTGVTITSGRLVSAAFGVAGVAAVFLMVRLILGPTMALVAAFLTAVMRWDINWSRIGMHGITAPLFAALTAYLTLRALGTGRRSDYGYAGAALGLGMWFYAAHRLFPLVVGFMLLHHLVLQRPPLRRFATQLAVMAVVALAVAAPVVQSAVVDSDDFFKRTRESSVFSHASVGDAFSQMKTSLGKHLVMFNYKGDPNPRHNLPDAPMLDFLSGVLLVLGTGIALIGWRNVALASLPVWMLLMVLPGVMTLPWEAPQSLRSIGALPAVIAAITVAVGTLWWVGRSAPWPLVRQGTPVVVALMLGVIAYANINTYFGEQARNPEVYAAFSTDETLMARDMVGAQRRGYDLLVSRHFVFSLNTTLLANQPRTRVLRAPAGVPLDVSEVSQGVSIYLEPREASVYRLLQASYPDGSFHEVRPPGGGDVLFHSAAISREQLEASHGLDAAYTTANGGSRLETQRTAEASWLSGPDRDDVPFMLAWTGSLHFTESGTYRLVLEDDVGAEVTLDGRRILWGGQRSIRIDPAVGLHTLEVTGLVGDTGGLLRLLWRPPGGELEAIPAGHLYHGPVRPVGLAGRFTPTGAGEEVATATHVTPAMDTFYYDPVIPEPYVAVWEGTLDVPARDRYRFEVGGAGAVTLAVDGVVQAQSPGRPPADSVGGVFLDAGDHPIRVEYRSDSPPSQFEVLWGLRGQPLAPIPIERLSPAPERMFRIVDAGE